MSPSRLTLGICKHVHRAAWRERASFCATGNAHAGAHISDAEQRSCPCDDKTQTELEAAVYRRLVEHLRSRTDVQNIDMMNLAGFCRNCLSNWMKDAADAKGVPMTKDQSREIVYGKPFEQWKAKHQKEASPEQKAAFEKSRRRTSTDVCRCPCHRRACRSDCPTCVRASKRHGGADLRCIHVLLIYGKEDVDARHQGRA